MKTGNLHEINYDLAYFILDEGGDVFQIGLELEKNVGKQLSKSLTKNGKDSSFSISQSSSGKVSSGSSYAQMNIELAPKKLSSRVKIIEIAVKSDGIFAKTIPYRDNKAQLKVLARFNLEKELEIVRSLVMSIKKQIAYEKIDLLGQQEIESSNLSECTTEQIDRMVFQVNFFQ